MVELKMTMTGHVKSGCTETSITIHNAEKDDTVWMMGILFCELQEKYGLDDDKIYGALKKAVEYARKSKVYDVL